MNTETNTLPQSYHWNKAQANIALFGGGGLTAVFTTLAFMHGGANKVEAHEVCAPENTACYEYVQAQEENNRLLLGISVLGVFGIGTVLTAANYSRRAEEIKIDHEGPGIL